MGLHGIIFYFCPIFLLKTLVSTTLPIFVSYTGFTLNFFWKHDVFFSQFHIWFMLLILFFQQKCVLMRNLCWGNSDIIAWPWVCNVAVILESILKMRSVSPYYSERTFWCGVTNSYWQNYLIPGILGSDKFTGIYSVHCSLLSPCKYY